MTAAARASGVTARAKGRQRTVVRVPVAPPTLHVIQPAPEHQSTRPGVFARQACGECAHLATCWAPNVQNNHVEINLLVCRLQAGIDTKRTTRRLLELWRPKLISLTEYVVRKAKHLNRAYVSAYLDERALTQAKTMYHISRIGYPLHHLFGKRGVIFFAAQSLIRSSKKQLRIAKSEILDETGEFVEGSYEWDAEAETDSARGTDAFMQLGQYARDTLTIREWRLYNAAVEWIRWREVLPPLSTLARVLRMDAKLAGTLWASVVAKLREAREASEDEAVEDEAARAGGS